MLVGVTPTEFMVLSCILILLMDGKIWVQQDGTEVGIANELVELAVPKKDIVSGFNPPKL
jgi:hypothetical protein